ncbi:MAG: hypothetical protein WC699_16625 [Bacteroidales bacterium]|jgi:hypothetical protein
MTDFYKNPYILSQPLPVDVVFHPSWWNRHAGIVFDEDFFYHPQKRVESEKLMEKVLYERFGQFGPGENRNKDLPVIGAVHLAAGYIIQEMLGCKVVYQADAPPQVIPAGMDKLEIDPGRAFRSDVFKKLVRLQGQLVFKYGYVTGDINWGGVLNVAIDLIGEQVFTDFYLHPEETRKQFGLIAAVIEQFVSGIAGLTGTSSISVNRNVRHIGKSVFLHSECTHTMISTEQYEEFLMPADIAWSHKFRPFGIHYCGKDPHRYAPTFSQMKNLDFLDAGWGGDIGELRKYLPHTFINIRLDPVTINSYTETEIEATITRLVNASGNPYLTGVCCINMDDRVEDSKVASIFRTVEKLRADV